VTREELVQIIMESGLMPPAFLDGVYAHSLYALATRIAQVQRDRDAQICEKLAEEWGIGSYEKLICKVCAKKIADAPVEFPIPTKPIGDNDE